MQMQNSKTWSIENTWNKKRNIRPLNNVIMYKHLLRSMLQQQAVVRIETDQSASGTVHLVFLITLSFCGAMSCSYLLYSSKS